jgi:hypothetical protein
MLTDIFEPVTFTYIAVRVLWNSRQIFKELSVQDKYTVGSDGQLVKAGQYNGFSYWNRVIPRAIPLLVNIIIFIFFINLTVLGLRSELSNQGLTGSFNYLLPLAVYEIGYWIFQSLSNILGKPSLTRISIHYLLNSVSGCLFIIITDYFLVRLK